MNLTSTRNGASFALEFDDVEIDEAIRLFIPWLEATRSAPTADVETRLASIDHRLTDLQARGVDMATALQQLNAELVKANATTNEIHDDMNTVLEKLAAADPDSPEAQSALAEAKALNDRLTGVASKYTPDSPVPTDPNA
jgi:uncharacterized coiled-coil protein SlyX